MYQLPLGIVGMAVAASIFPLLSRHAAHGRRGRLGADLTLGLRLVLCLSVPAGVGLIVLALRWRNCCSSTANSPRTTRRGRPA